MRLVLSVSVFQVILGNAAPRVFELRMPGAVFLIKIDIIKHILPVTLAVQQSGAHLIIEPEEPVPRLLGTVLVLFL